MTWQLLEKQMDLNSGKRINWKNIYGKSLTKKIAECFGKGYSEQQTLEVLERKLIDANTISFNHLKNLRIGISARFSEIESEQMEIRKVKA